eukprot:m.18313 g.18313  ORF g.18313 m.18313 type:complete len:166 (+) comp11427_c0_seq1:453-950(+)
MGEMLSELRAGFLNGDGGDSESTMGQPDDKDKHRARELRVPKVDELAVLLLACTVGTVLTWTLGAIHGMWSAIGLSVCIAILIASSLGIISDCITALPVSVFGCLVVFNSCTIFLDETPYGILLENVLLVDRVSTSIAAGLLLAFVNDERNANRNAAADKGQKAG